MDCHPCFAGQSDRQFVALPFSRATARKLKRRYVPGMRCPLVVFHIDHIHPPFNIVDWKTHDVANPRSNFHFSRICCRTFDICPNRISL